MNTKIKCVLIALGLMAVVQIVVLQFYYVPYRRVRLLFPHSTLQPESKWSTKVQGKSILDVAYANSISISRHTLENEIHVNESVTTPSGYFHSISQSGRRWQNESFCHDFIENTFHEKVPLCNSNITSASDQISCFRSPHSVRMATCTIRNLVIDPHALYKSPVDADGIGGIRHSNSTWLMENAKTTCRTPIMEGFSHTIEGGDYIRAYVDELIANKRKNSTVCDHWIHEPTFLFVSHDFHIYFRILAWYNLFKSLRDNNVMEGKFRIYRIAGGDRYLFQDYEKQLFPELRVINELPSGLTCFEKVILVPRTYSSTLFRCKMSPSIRHKCFACNGTELDGTSLSEFRRHVLHTCGISQHLEPSTTRANQMIMILRKPYVRHSKDIAINFQRVLRNQQELIDTLNISFPSTEVLPFYLEDLSICEQIRHAHEAEVVIGVHGAGLVHMWWMREAATGVELEPFHQAGNPTFRMLTTLTGRNYRSISIKGSSSEVEVDVSQVVKAVGVYLSN